MRSEEKQQVENFFLRIAKLTYKGKKGQMSLIEELLKEEEGLILQAYDDGTEKVISPGTTFKGHPTIGYGRALDVEGITKEEALYLLRNDIAAVQAQAAKRFLGSTDF